MDKLKILYAKPMTDVEVKSFYSFLNSKSKNLKESSNSIINNIGQKLIEAYHKIDSEFYKEQYDNNQTHKRYMNAYMSDRCVCGSDLIYVSLNGGFYGCKNYKSVCNHKNFMDHKKNNWGVPKLYESTKPKSYLSSIIQSLSLKGEINTKSLLKFYSDNGLEDLGKKYCNTDANDLINRFQKAKKVANNFENIVLER